MKQLIKALLVLGFTSTIGLTTASAQPFTNATWTFDELGSGILQGGGIVGFSNGTNKMDTVSGITTLFYNVGFPAAPGDVILFEPGVGGNTNISDLIRFDGQGGMFFFSEREAGEINPDPADVQVLPGTNPLLPVIFLTEVGPEGNNGVFYKPLAGQPGFDPTGVLPGLQYHFISDVPEPSPAALLLCGVSIWGFIQRQRRLRQHRS